MVVSSHGVAKPVPANSAKPGPSVVADRRPPSRPQNLMTPNLCAHHFPPHGVTKSAYQISNFSAAKHIIGVCENVTKPALAKPGPSVSAGSLPPCRAFWVRWKQPCYTINIVIIGQTFCKN